jgi:hypothetical protein
MAKQAEVIDVSPYEALSKKMIDGIRVLRADIPRFVAEEPGEAQALAPLASVNEAFIESASASIPKSLVLENAPDAATLRDSVAFVMAYEAALTEAQGFTRAIEHTLRVAKATAGKSALDIYAFAQRLAKRKDGAELVPHVADMQRKLKRGRRKATSEPAPDKSVKPAPKQ